MGNKSPVILPPLALQHGLQLRHHVASSGVELVLLASRNQSPIALSLHRALQVTHVLSDLRDLEQMSASSSSKCKRAQHTSKSMITNSPNLAVLRKFTFKLRVNPSSSQNPCFLRGRGRYAMQTS
jgi:hypothetical protein